jgi:dTDP-4-dehydrorhamnose reductase
MIPPRSSAPSVNALFPLLLATAAERANARVIQIATDCVFSGTRGSYREDSPHDALDVYGKTKSLGEVSSPHVHHLRASIIGPEPKEHKFLLDWFLGQARGAIIDGFTNHDWNGVTTLHFARVAAGAVAARTPLPELHHLIPSGRITKAEMLDAFAVSYRRHDLKINKVAASSTIDRTLETNDKGLNTMLWDGAGYFAPPTVETMIAELAQFNVPFGRWDMTRT